MVPIAGLGPPLGGREPVEGGYVLPGAIGGLITGPIPFLDCFLCLEDNSLKFCCVGRVLGFCGNGFVQNHSW